MTMEDKKSKRKFRICKLTLSRLVEDSVLYGKKEIRKSTYYIYFYESLLDRILGHRIYLKMKGFWLYGKERFLYRFVDTPLLATEFDSVEEAEERIKLMNEEPDLFRYSYYT